MIFDFLFRKKTLPYFLEEYEDNCKTGWQNKTPIDKIRFVVFDTETTGLDIKNAELLSYGGIAIENKNLLLADSLEMIFQHEDVEVNKTASIHGIMKSHSKEIGVSFEKALERIIHFIGNAVLVGHHVDFDARMLDKVLGTTFLGASVRNKTLDTALLARRLEHFNDGYIPKSGEYTLDACAERYDIPIVDRHTAAGDAFITGQLLLKLLNKCEARGITTFKDLIR